MKTQTLLSAAFLAALLAGCGSSGSDANDDDPGSQSSSSLSSESSQDSSSSSSSSSDSSSSSSVSPPNTGGLSNDCINLATNPSVNWRDTGLQSDQDIVECLSATLGRALGYGEDATGGYDPAGSSALTIITTQDSRPVEQQIVEAIAGNDHNWIVFDKFDFAEPHEIGLYRNYCNNSTVLNRLNATQEECVDYRLWCSNRGISDSAACMESFFNDRLNLGSLPIRNPVIGSNTTIDGRMSQAYFRFSGFAIGRDSSGSPTQTSNNVILTHLNFQGAGHTEDHGLDPDMIRSTGASADIWIHRNTFDLTGDSAFDVKVGARNITLSFNRVTDVVRAALHGSSDSRTINEHITTTFHHNAFITRDERYMTFGNTGRRVPLIRRGTSHMFNNVFINYRKDVFSARVGARILFEDNAFVINQIHQEKTSVEASLSELKNNLLRDVRTDASLRAEGSHLWFSDGLCALIDSTQTDLSTTSGNDIPDLGATYNTHSRTLRSEHHLDAGQDLVDYVYATAGHDQVLPFNSPLAGDVHYVLALERCSGTTSADSI
ncbi:pectate lyase family protein [Marinimicrobium alkaliphilum]|uniref:pectate lyase family protein n=1 Tax=Marinimicrobium alkaliphilum TaxID=2202654 RepID=UPI001E4F7CBD|nr:pectate lyase [Marinimicrobium alkaliphilum]